MAINPGVGAATISGTVDVHIGSTAGTLRTGDIPGTVAVYFSPSNPAVSATFSGTVGVNLGKQDGTIRISDVPGTVAVYFSPANPAVAATFSGSIAAVPTSGSGSPLYDDTADAARVIISGSHAAASLEVKGTLTGITNSVAVHVLSTNGTMAVNIGKIDGTIAVYLHSTGGTLGVRVGQIDGTTAIYLHSTSGTLRVKLDPAGTAFTNAGHTASIFTVSGSTSGVSASGVNLIAPSSAYSFKIFAYSIQTTVAASIVARFVNGSAASQTEFWRPLVTAAATSAPTGANLAVPPPAFIFATGTSTSLNLHLDTAALVHYSVSYIKESA